MNPEDKKIEKTEKTDYSRRSKEAKKETVTKPAEKVVVEEPKPKVKEDYGFVENAVTLNLRSKPDLNSSVLAVMPPNSKVKIVSSANGWSHVTFGEINGYCLTKHIKTR